MGLLSLWRFQKKDRVDELMNNTSRITIQLINGDVHTYDFEPRGDGSWSSAGRIAKVFEGGHLRMRVAGNLVVYPIASVLRVELSPAPEDINDPVARPVA